MKHFVLVILYAAIVYLPLQAQHSVLWKITPPGSSINSYVLGTTDAPGAEEIDIAASVSDAMNKVNAVAFSWLPTEDEKQILYSIHQRTDDASLKRYYKREDQIRFELMIKNKLNDDPEKYLNSEPIFVMQLFVNKDHDGATEMQRQAVYDLSLQKTKPALSLLTARQLATIMDHVSFDTQAAILLDYVNRETAFKDADAKLLSAYLNQDMDAYQNIFNTVQIADYINSYYNDVNNALVEKMATISSQQSTLFVVDAGQLVGDNGLISKLEKDGYETEDVKISIERKTNTQNSSQNNDVVSDNFPSLILIEPKQNSNDIAVVNAADTMRNFQPLYSGLYDPFGDLFDYASIDTSFLHNWFTLRSSEANFSILVPRREEWETSSINDINGVIQYGTNSLNDARSDLYYSVGYTIYPPQFNPGTKAEFFNSFVKSQQTKLNGELLDERIISTPEYTGREFTIIVADSFFVRSKLILKGNILYQILVGGPGDNPYSKYAAAFFNTFKIAGSKTSDWFFYQNPSFESNFPTPPGKSSQTYSTSSGPLTIDTYSSDDYREGISYFVSVNTYPVGYKFKGENAFYKDLVAQSERTYVGRAVKTDNVKKDGRNGKHAILQLNNGKIYEVYFFIDHNIVYQYLAGGDPLAMHSPNVQYFFETFRLPHK